ncbi:MAG: bifunctional folylpolyglutamate synthase/dihydrofolate synthase, partial [Rhodospirillales bacterium]|nr:bifunctional folylpolyglutamate synthase/dihydrofolate synthase [Rhodospirillales bacterium]
RVEALLNDLGNPHRALPPVVHVAGTNGKGSVIAFLKAILQSAGYRTHVFTSPHLIRFNERICVGGKDIEDEALTAILEECERVNRERPITFFEITTAAAFLAFAREPADIVLLETGLGGRLDATNMVPKPALTVITPISLDHQNFLGDTIEQIAAEKAGILKPGVPCLCAAQTRKAKRVLTSTAGKTGSPLIEEGKDWFVLGREDGLLFKAGSEQLRLPLPALTGKHQLGNAGTAIACARELSGFCVSEQALADGLREARWPARLQRLARGPLPDLLPEGWELWLDGGHNPAAAKVLANHSRRWRDKPLHLVFGMMTGKDPIRFLKPLEAVVAHLRGVDIPGEDGALPADKAALAAEYLAIEAAPAPSVSAAIADIVKKTQKPARILICGSLYLAGHVLRDNA